MVYLFWKELDNSFTVLFLIYWCSDRSTTKQMHEHIKTCRGSWYCKYWWPVTPRANLLQNWAKSLAFSCFFRDDRNHNNRTEQWIPQKTHQLWLEMVNDKASRSENYDPNCGEEIMGCIYHILWGTTLLPPPPHTQNIAMGGYDQEQSVCGGTFIIETRDHGLQRAPTWTRPRHSVK